MHNKANISSLVLAAVLGVMLGTASLAQSPPFFPPQIGPNTIVGRLGSGTTGPAQAIPFASLPFYGPIITPEQFGAVGNGTTDDTAAVQAAVTALVTNTKFPTATLYLGNSYFISSSININASAIPAPLGFFSIRGSGKDFTFAKNGNFSALKFTGDTTNTIADVTVSDISCIDNQSAPSTGGACIDFESSGAGVSVFSLFRIHNILGFNLHDTILVNGPLGIDHSSFSDITVWNGYNGITFTTTTNTANTFTNLILILNASGNIGFLAGDGTGNVGDFSISNLQGDGGAIGLQLTAGVSYGDNVFIGGFQWNGGTTDTFKLVGMHNVHFTGNWDGSTAFSVDANSRYITTDFNQTISTDSLSGSQNNYQPTVSSAAIHYGRYINLTASTPINITGLADGWDGRLIDLYNNGSNTITLVNASASSSAANRFNLGSNATIAAGQSIALRYSGTASTVGWYRVGGQ